jgi:hypothetical protein
MSKKPAIAKFQKFQKLKKKQKHGISFQIYVATKLAQLFILYYISSKR